MLSLSAAQFIHLAHGHLSGVSSCALVLVLF